MSVRPRPTEETAGSDPATPAVAGEDRTPPRRPGPPPHLVLCGLAPGRLCAQWGASGPDWERAVRRAPQGRPALRLYRLDGGHGRPAGAILFVEAAEGMRTIDAREGVFVAEFGLLHPDGRMDRLAASAPAAVPAAAESEDRSLLVIDVRAPPPAPPTAPPGARFLRLFARSRHPQTILRRRGGRTPAAPDPSIPSAPAPAGAPGESRGPVAASSGAGSGDTPDGWPLAIRGILDRLEPDGEAGIDGRCPTSAAPSSPAPLPAPGPREST